VDHQEKGLLKRIVNGMTFFGSFPKWVGKFCEVLDSDQLSSEQKSAVTKAIYTLLESDENIEISGDFLVENISKKYGLGQNAIDAFQKGLSDAMGENYPPVLSKSPFFKDFPKRFFDDLRHGMRFVHRPPDINRTTTQAP
jgi:hypothetical protein